MALSKETISELGKYKNLNEYSWDHPIVVNLRKMVERDTYHYDRPAMRYDAISGELAPPLGDIREFKDTAVNYEIVAIACKQQEEYKGYFWRWADEEVKPDSHLALKLEKRERALREMRKLRELRKMQELRELREANKRAQGRTETQW